MNLFFLFPVHLFFLRVYWRGACERPGATAISAVLGWVGLGWIGLGWVGLGWVGLGWAELGWVGLGWIRLCCDVLRFVVMHCVAL